MKAIFARNTHCLSFQPVARIILAPNRSGIRMYQLPPERATWVSLNYRWWMADFYFLPCRNNEGCWTRLGRNYEELDRLDGFHCLNKYLFSLAATGIFVYLYIVSLL